MAKRKTPTKQPRKDRNAKNSSPGPVNGQGIEKPQVIDLANLSQFMPASVLNKLKVDPSDGVQDAPPNWGQQIVPQIATVMGRVTAGTQIYWPNDEALRHMRVNAQAMRNDCGIMECLEHRQRATAMLKWHIEPEDPQDTAQKEIAAELQLMLERIGMPIQGSAATSNGFLEYRRFLMEAIWYGRVAIQNAWNWQKIRGKMRCVPTKWIPINGDKLVFRWDDGSGTYEDGQIGIRVTLGGFPAEASSETVKQVEPADYSQAYMLRPFERELLTVHKHIIEDGPFEEPRDAGTIHGVGIRSRIYWTWYQMQNALAWFMEYMERSAFGIEVWTYPANNPAAQEATKQSALNRVGGGRTAIMVPVFPGEDSQQYGLKLVEPGLQGVELLKEVVHNFFFHKIKRYILGQTLTSEADATGMGSELATVHLTTFLDVVRFDAQKLGESITADLVAPMVRYNFPAYRDVFFRFVCDTEAPETEKKLEALAKAWQMGLKIKSSDVYALLGISPPDITDEILGRPEPGAGVLQDPNAPQGGGFGGKDQQPTNDNPSGDGGLDIPQDQPNSTDEPSGDGPPFVDKNAKWEESKHPRADDGKFGEGGGDGSVSEESEDIIKPMKRPQNTRPDPNDEEWREQHQDTEATGYFDHYEDWEYYQGDERHQFRKKRMTAAKKLEKIAADAGWPVVRIDATAKSGTIYVYFGTEDDSAKVRFADHPSSSTGGGDAEWYPGVKISRLLEDAATRRRLPPKAEPPQ